MKEETFKSLRNAMLLGVIVILVALLLSYGANMQLFYSFTYSLLGLGVAKLRVPSFAPMRGKIGLCFTLACFIVLAILHYNTMNAWKARVVRQTDQITRLVKKVVDQEDECAVRLRNFAHSYCPEQTSPQLDPLPEEK